MSSAAKPIVQSRNETVIRDVALTEEADVILASGSIASTSGEGRSASNASAKKTKPRQKSAAAFGEQARAAAVPDEFRLGANYPNPFRASTEVRFGLPEAAEVSLEVYDMLGRRVAVLANGQMEAGHHRARLDGSELSSGVYVYRLVAGDDFTDTGRMVLVK